MKRVPGYYWVVLVHWCSVPTVAYWTGERWCKPAEFLCTTVRVRKVIARITPPTDGMIPLPVERVLLDTGKGYREELNVDRVNHATGAVYVSRRAKL